MTLTQDQIAHVRSLEDGLGNITPDMIVADAKRPDSPLHDLFEWDPNIAAAAHWIQQAREVIGAVRVVIVNQTTTIRVPVYVRDPDATGQGYRSVMALRSEPEKAREALITTLKTAGGHLQRGHELAEVLGLQGEIDELIEQLVGLQRKLTSIAA
jgi:hypothetical protein